MHWVDPLFTSRPTQVASSLWKIVPTSQMAKDVGYTLTEVAIGYSIGVALGVLVGFVLGTSKLMRDACQPVLNALNSVPRIALVPLFVAWFGLGMTPRVVMAVTVVVFVMVTAMVTALSQRTVTSERCSRGAGCAALADAGQVPAAARHPGDRVGPGAVADPRVPGRIAVEIVSGSKVGVADDRVRNLFQAGLFVAWLSHRHHHASDRRHPTRRAALLRGTRPRRTRE